MITACGFTSSAGCGAYHFADTIKVAISDSVKVFAYNLNGIPADGGVLNAGPLLLGIFFVPPRPWFSCWHPVHSSDANSNGGMIVLMFLFLRSGWKSLALQVLLQNTARGKGLTAAPKLVKLPLSACDKDLEREWVGRRNVKG